MPVHFCNVVLQFCTATFLETIIFSFFHFFHLWIRTIFVTFLQQITKYVTFLHLLFSYRCIIATFLKLCDANPLREVRYTPQFRYFSLINNAKPSLIATSRMQICYVFHYRCNENALAGNKIA